MTDNRQTDKAQLSFRLSFRFVCGIDKKLNDLLLSVMIPGFLELTNYQMLWVGDYYTANATSDLNEMTSLGETTDRGNYVVGIGTKY